MNGLEDDVRGRSRLTCAAKSAGNGIDAVDERVRSGSPSAAGSFGIDSNGLPRPPSCVGSRLQSSRFGAHGRCGRRPRVPHIRAWSWNNAAFLYALLYLKMLWRGLRTRFDVVHCHDLDTLPLGFVLGKLKRKPIVYDAHESFPDMLEGSVHPLVQRGLVRLENFLIRRIDLLITVGEKLRRHFEERGSENSIVVGNWKRVDDFFRTDEQNLEVRRLLGIPAGALIVVCITQLLKDRKIVQLIASADNCPNVYVVVGGKGQLESLVTDAAARNPRIVFTGFVSGRQIADYTCAADIVYYGFDPENPNARFSAPNKLYEALAAGRPLITGDFGEIADVVRDAECGVVLRKYSAEDIHSALSLLEDSNTRDRMAANARRFGRAVFNWEKAEEILHRAYSELLPGSGLPASTPQTTAAAIAGRARSRRCRSALCM